MYKSTFYDWKISPKKSLSTYTWVIDKYLTQTIQEISITIAWSPLVKLSLQNQF